MLRACILGLGFMGNPGQSWNSGQEKKLNVIGTEGAGWPHKFLKPLRKARDQAQVWLLRVGGE